MSKAMANTALTDPCAAAPSERLLVFQPEVHGHHPDHVRHVLEYCAQQRPEQQIDLSVHPRLVRDFWDDRGWRERFRNLDIRLDVIPDDLAHRCTHGPLVLRGITQWRALRRALDRTGSREVLALNIDMLQLPLALQCRFGGDCRLSGIIFRPSIHYRWLPDSRPKWHEWPRDVRKWVVYSAMLLNPTLHKLLSLDEYFPRMMARYLPASHKLATVPDPSLSLESPGTGLSPATPVDPPANRRMLLLFGALDRRKGLHTTLEAAAELEAGVAAQVALVFAGRVAAKDKDELEASVARLRQRRPEIWVHVEDRYLEETELKALVERADVVLAPYQRFVGSSGVLLWAAGAGKPVITQSYGLLGVLTERHGLGVAIDTTDALVLSKALRNVVLEPLETLADPAAIRAFAADHTPYRFAASLFEAVDSHR